MACKQKLSNYISCLTLFLLLMWTSEIFGSSSGRNSVYNVIQAGRNQNQTRFASKNGSTKLDYSSCSKCKKDNNFSPTTVPPKVDKQQQQQRTVANEISAAGGISPSKLAPNVKTKHQKNVLHKPHCSDCRKETIINLSDTDMQKLRIDDIKAQILNRLRMKDPPKVAISKKMVPTPIMQWNVPYNTADVSEKNLDDYFAKTEQMIIMSEIIEYPFCPTITSDPAGCFSFNVNENLLDKEINSAELWVFKLRDERDKHNQTYLVTDFVRDNQSIVKRTNTVAIRDTSLKDGWLKFDLTTTVQRWIQKPNTSAHMLEISCKTCAMDKDKVPVSSDPGERPFIVINFNHEGDKKRNRRGINCEENTKTCCMESLYVNFTEIQWNDWIFQPEGYFANYCKGSCNGEITLSTDKHATVIQRYIEANRNKLSPSKLADLELCCTSTRTSHLQILYLDNSTNVRMELIPNMVVEACGCN